MQRPQEVDAYKVAAISSDGTVSVLVVEGGLDIDKAEERGRTNYQGI